MAFQGLINALDGRGSTLQAADIWQWYMDGSGGSLWNIDNTPPIDQPNNQALAQMLSSFVGTAVYPLAGDFNRDGVVDMRDYVMWRDNLGKNVLGIQRRRWRWGRYGGRERLFDLAFALMGKQRKRRAGGRPVPEPASLVRRFACRDRDDLSACRGTLARAS